MKEPASSPSTNPPRERRTWIDTAKGLGILSVVIGHAAGLSESWDTLRAVIYLFHMPLFFMISGMLLRAEDPMRSFTRKLSEYLPPYLGYLLVFGIAFQTHAVIHELGGSASGAAIAMRVVEDLIYGGARLKGALTVFWYLPVLFVAVQLTNLIAYLRPAPADRLPLFLTAFGVAVVGGASMPAMVDVFDPFDVLVVPLVLVFLFAGRLTAPLLLGDDHRRRSIVAVAAASIVAIDLAYLSAQPELAQFDLKVGRIGVPVIGLAGAIAFSILVLLAAKSIDRTGPFARATRRLGAASLTIMFVHPPMIFLAAMLRGQRPDLVDPLWVVPASLVISLVAHRLYENHHCLSRIFLGRGSSIRTKSEGTSPFIRRWRPHL